MGFGYLWLLWYGKKTEIRIKIFITIYIKYFYYNKIKNFSFNKHIEFVVFLSKSNYIIMINVIKFIIFNSLNVQFLKFIKIFLLFNKV